MSFSALSEGNLVLVDKHLGESLCIPLKNRALILQELHDTLSGGRWTSWNVKSPLMQ